MNNSCTNQEGAGHWASRGHAAVPSPGTFPGQPRWHHGASSRDAPCALAPSPSPQPAEPRWCHAPGNSSSTAAHSKGAFCVVQHRGKEKKGKKKKSASFVVWDAEHARNQPDCQVVKSHRDLLAAPRAFSQLLPRSCFPQEKCTNPELLLATLCTDGSEQQMPPALLLHGPQLPDVPRGTCRALGSSAGVRELFPKAGHSLCSSPATQAKLHK